MARRDLQRLTELNQLQREAREERDFALQVINILGQGLTVTDANSRFILVNPAFTRMPGYEANELIGTNTWEIAVDNDHPILDQAFKDRKQGQTTTYSGTIRKKDGGALPVLVTGVPRVITGEYAGTIASFTDMTEIIRAEAEREALIQKLEAQNAELERFTYTVSQESSTEFVLKASGIKSRFVVDKDGILDPDVMCPRIAERPNDQISILAEMAVTAAKEALARAGRKPADIDCVLVACSNLQRAYPAIAIEVQNALGAQGFAFDMNVACSSATFGMQAAADMIRAGNARTALVVNPEICSGHLNFRDRVSHFIFGDVATAIVLEPASEAKGPHAWEILGTRLKTQFSNNIRNNFGFLNRTHIQAVCAASRSRSRTK